MKLFFAIATVSFGLLLSVQSCLSCYKCKRSDLEAKCVRPNDTLIFNQDLPTYGLVHRYYRGGDSIFVFSNGSQGFDKSVQEFTDSGYTCSVYSIGTISEVKRCNQPGEGDDDDFLAVYHYERLGYACHEYKGH